jgi:hypothetical protein
MLKSANKGFRYHAGDDPALKDFSLIKNYSTSTVSLKPVTQSFFSHKPDQTKSLFILENAIIDPLSSYVYDSKHRFMGDFSSWSIDHSMCRFTMRPPKRFSTLGKGTYLFLGSNTYYHWLIEELPVYLRARREFPSATTLVHALAPIYVFDSLKLLDINYKVIQKCIQVEKLVFVSKSATLQPDSGDTDVLRETYLPLIENTSSTESEVQVYISRLNQGRFPQNELAIQELFTDYGFQILDLVGRSFKDQIELFSKANVVAGTHGAGLSNIVWSGPKASVIEIIDWKHPKCFEVLAQIGSQRYFGIQNSGQEWTVDLENLNSTIAFSLEKK